MRCILLFAGGSIGEGGQSQKRRHARCVADPNAFASIDIERAVMWGDSTEYATGSPSGRGGTFGIEKASVFTKVSVLIPPE